MLRLRDRGDCIVTLTPSNVFVFDFEGKCGQLPHRFFASVNGRTISSRLALFHCTGNRAYRRIGAMFLTSRSSRTSPVFDGTLGNRAKVAAFRRRTAANE